MVLWEVTKDLGFLPTKYPSTGDFVYYPYSEIGRLADSLTAFSANRSVREELVSGLRGIGNGILYHSIHNASEVELEYLWRCYCYFASSYIWAPNENPQKRIPVEIAQPLSYMGQILDRKPILSYMAYCLFNWEIKTVHPGKFHNRPSTTEIKLGNIDLVQNFVGGEIKKDEDWFILVHVDIEARAAQAIKGIIEIERHIERDNGHGFGTALADIQHSLQDINKTMDRMTENCSPEVYFDKVRPYIYSFEDVVYEGISPTPVTYRGETGAQSSIVPAIQIALGVEHKDSMLTTHLEDMRNYMPKEHRVFLENLENRKHKIRPYLLGKEKWERTRECYNECVKQLAAFRNTHLRYAVDYIQNKCDDPKGTGGTPFVPWLTQLQKETEEYLL